MRVFILGSAAAKAAWGLFEAAEYHVVTVAWYVAIVGMLSLSSYGPICPSPLLCLPC